ncbi:hypothetical protein AB6A40_005296 [Gnathostoma spinigerum]|uniref:PHD-type domain-containing protein n=1 Tax=Gnathostoma spinigerum TaxID=75299 RepID=A0ABD6EPI4_9BILA
MATTVVLQANDLHNSDQPSHDIGKGQSPLLQSFSPHQSLNSNLAGQLSVEATPSATYTTNFPHTNFSNQPSRSIYQNLTPEPAHDDQASFPDPASNPGSSCPSLAASAPLDIIYIRDPFYEPPRKRPPNTQPPPSYVNTGNPMYSGGQLVLPRNLRVPYPEYAYEAVALANKAYFAQVRPRMIPYPPQMTNVTSYPRHMMVNNSISPAYQPQLQPSSVPVSMPSYPVHQVRQLNGQKLPVMQQPSMSSYPYYSPVSSTVSNTSKKTTSNASHRKYKQNAKAALTDERIPPKNVRMSDYNSVSVSNPYEHMGEPVNPCTSSVANFGAPTPNSVTSAPSAASALTFMDEKSPNYAKPADKGYPFESYDAGLGISTGNDALTSTVYPGGERISTSQTSSSIVPSSETGALLTNAKYSQPNCMMNDVKRDTGGRSSAIESDLKVSHFQPSSSTLSKIPNGIQPTDESPYSVQNGDIMRSPVLLRQTGSLVSQQCALCKDEINAERLGIQCTGNNQGCLQYYHQECSQLLPESFSAILNEPRAAWICNQCVAQQPSIAYS